MDNKGETFYDNLLSMVYLHPLYAQFYSWHLNLSTKMKHLDLQIFKMLLLGHMSMGLSLSFLIKHNGNFSHEPFYSVSLKLVSHWSSY